MNNKPRILLLVDKKGWAFDIAATSISKYLCHKFNFIIRYVSDKPNLNKDKFDLIYVFFWGETYHLKFVKDSKRIIKEVSSHRWENEEKYGFLIPEQMVKTYLSDAGYIVTTSCRLQNLLSPYREVEHCPNGFEPEIFNNKNKRKGKLNIGWAGDKNDPCKGLNDIILPACNRSFNLHIAGGNLNQIQMSEFYNKIDVLCIASTAEGEPLTLIEGMASGCFPVCTDVGITSELINNGYNGLIVDRSIQDFKNALVWCEQNLENVRRIGKINSYFLNQVRTWEKVMPFFEYFFYKVIYENQLNDMLINNHDISQERKKKEAENLTIMNKGTTDYETHLSRMTPDATSESAYLSAFNYYEAEIKQILPESRAIKIVDIGSGYGHLSRYLLELGYQNIGCVDTSKKLLEVVKNYLGDSLDFFANEDGCDFLSNNVEQFDLITFIDVIEHFSLTDAKKITEAAFNALRPGGRVIIRTPNMANILGMYSRHLDLTHYHGYTEYSLKQLLENAGFKKVEINIPDWSHNSQRAIMKRINDYLHRKLFSLHDRVQPKCFDKNIIVWADK